MRPSGPRGHRTFGHIKIEAPDATTAGDNDKAFFKGVSFGLGFARVKSSTGGIRSRVIRASLPKGTE